jgi:hypothetical protein
MSRESTRPTSCGEWWLNRYRDQRAQHRGFTKVSFAQAGTSLGWGARRGGNTASPFTLRLNNVTAKKKLVVFREVTVVGVSPGYKAGTRVRLFWRQVGKSEWITAKGAVATVNGKIGQTLTFKNDFGPKNSGQRFEFRLVVGEDASESKTFKLP